ncbi:flagellar motor protein MotB [Rubricella aquisinus]|uniref:Flagellar motor protein MotB n=1 Tax=Rubricella aquisinus TaxID=2028108 RepID=A0A840X2U5_9RHOB|nr:OmpA family protein [Rubricella aquisinus]MBB5516166.1 flagellar motor protein MotB [Rubricella aquisinus]
MTPFDLATNSVEHEEEENYFVSMTDMMVGVLFIFIIMLMVFAMNFREQTDEQERISAERLRILEELEQETERVAQRLEHLRGEVRDEIDVLATQQGVRNRLLRDIREALEDEGLVVEIDERNGVLRLTEDAVRFGTNSSALSGTNRRNVGRIGAALATVLPAYTACSQTTPTEGCGRTGSTTVETVFIEGHTDNTGGDNRNWQLSTERAVTTYRAIATDEPLLTNLRNRAGRQIMSVSGYAATRPVTNDRTADGLARNRRIDLRFVMETDTRRRLGEILELTDAMQGEIKKLRDLGGQ